MGDRVLAHPSTDLVRVYAGILEARATLGKAVTLGSLSVRKEIDAHLAELGKAEETVVGFAGPVLRAAGILARRALMKWGPRALAVASGFGRLVFAKLKNWSGRLGKLPRWAKVVGAVTVASELGVLERAMRAIGRALGLMAKELLEGSWPVLLLVGAVVLWAKR